jgi:uncharacterized repeat protein (TIGR01451 family)
VVASAEGATSSNGPALISLFNPPTIVADFNYSPSQITLDSPVSFTSTSITNGSPLVAWDWDFGDGAIASGSTTIHTYTTSGVYTATLTVTDACGYSDVVTNTLEVLAPILTLTKSAAPAPVEAGGLLTYTIVAANSGGANATGVTISDPLPANTSFVTGSVSLTPAGTGLIGDPPTLVSNLTITAGQSVTVTFTVRVDKPLLAGTILTNTASLSSPQIAFPLSSTVTTTVVATPSLNIVKSGPATANVGQTVVFTFSVTNNGNTLLQNLVVEDNLAGPATFIGGDNGDSLLDLSETWLYTAAYTIPPTALNPLVNTGTVTATDALATSAVATATHTTLIEFGPILTMTKQGPITAFVGLPATFTFTVSHAPGSDGSGLTILAVTDTIAGPATFVPGGDQNSNNLLDAAETWTYVVNYIIKPGDLNPLVNTGLVSARDMENDVITATASHTTTLVGYAPVMFVDKDGPARAKVGDTVVYTITVINFTNMAMLTQFDIDLELVELASLEPGDGSPIDITFIWDDLAQQSPSYVSGDTGGHLGLLDGGEGWVYTVTYTVQPGDPLTLTNQVDVTGLDQEGDLIPGSAAHTITVRPTGLDEIFLPIIRKK